MQIGTSRNRLVKDQVQCSRRSGNSTLFSQVSCVGRARGLLELRLQVGVGQREVGVHCWDPISADGDVDVVGSHSELLGGRSVFGVFPTSDRGYLAATCLGLQGWTFWVGVPQFWSLAESPQCLKSSATLVGMEFGGDHNVCVDPKRSSNTPCPQAVLSLLC